MRRNSSGSISGWAEAAPPLTAMNATTVAQAHRLENRRGCSAMRRVRLMSSLSAGEQPSLAEDTAAATSGAAHSANRSTHTHTENQHQSEESTKARGKPRTGNRLTLG